MQKLSTSRQRVQAVRMGKSEARGAIEHLLKVARSRGKCDSDSISPFRHHGVPARFWGDKRNLRKAMVLLHFATGKKYGLLKNSDFMEHGLIGIPNVHGGTYAAALAAGLADIRPWELHPLPVDFWGRKEFRLDAMRWTISKMNKQRKSLSDILFEQPYLSSLFYGHYKGNFRVAAEEAKEARIGSSDLIHIAVSQFVGIFKTR